MYPLNDSGHLIGPLPILTHEAGEPLVSGDYVKFDLTLDPTRKIVVKANSLAESVGYYYSNISLSASKGCLIMVVYLANGNTYGSLSTSLGNCCNFQLQGPSSELCFEDSNTFGPEQLLINNDYFTTPVFFNSYNNNQSLLYQTFTLAQDFKLTKIEFAFRKVSNPTGNIFFQVSTDNAGSPNSLISNSSDVDLSTISTAFSGTEDFIFASEPLIATNMGMDTFGFNSKFQAGAVLNGTNNLQSWKSIAAGYMDGAYSNSPDDGATWLVQPSDMRFKIYGKLGGGSASKNFIISSDIWIQVPSMQNSSNNIAAQTITLPNPNDVAYVIINTIDTPTNLTVLVSDIGSVDQNNPLLYIIARRVEDKLSIGLNSNLILDVGECGLLDEVVQSQDFETHVITWTALNAGSIQTINTGFSKIINVVSRDNLNECEIETHICIKGQDVDVCSNIEGTFTYTIEGYN